MGVIDTKQPGRNESPAHHGAHPTHVQSGLILPDEARGTGSALGDRRPGVRGAALQAAGPRDRHARERLPAALSIAIDKGDVP